MRSRLPAIAVATLILLLVLCAPAAAASGQVTVVQTTVSLRDALTVKAPQRFTARPARGSVVIRVNPNVRYQQIKGFGAAMTDSSAWLLYDELTPEWRAATMNLLFGPAGIDLNFLRIPIGASDYTVSPAPYSYDDLATGRTDPTMADFSIEHDEAYVIPAVREALAVNPGMFTLANPWSAPPWMKTNGTFDNVALAGSVQPQYYRRARAVLRQVHRGLSGRRACRSTRSRR